jgi:hypothetical protein
VGKLGNYYAHVTKTNSTKSCGKSTSIRESNKISPSVNMQDIFPMPLQDSARSSSSRGNTKVVTPFSRDTVSTACEAKSPLFKDDCHLVVSLENTPENLSHAPFLSQPQRDCMQNPFQNAPITTCACRVYPSTAINDTCHGLLSLYQTVSSP